MNPTTPITDPVELRTATLRAIAAAPPAQATFTAPKTPTAWNQDYWRCGSGMCFAGHAAALAGARFLYSEQDRTPMHNVIGAHVMGAAGVDARTVVADDNGELYTIAYFATYALGLDADQASVLFDGSNTLATLTRMVEKLNAGGHLTDDDLISNTDDEDDDDWDGE